MTDNTILLWLVAAAITLGLSIGALVRFLDAL